ncbi:MAG: hypothetical protein ACTSQ8_26635 [Candidatus Helarchaeota archaeon]
MLETSNKTELLKSLRGSAILCQDIELYVVTKLQNLILDIRSMHITSWSDLGTLKNAENIKKLNEEFKEFRLIWEKWWNSVGEERQRRSQELHNWLQVHMSE